MNPASTSVVLLAAGQGKRMLPLTKTTPKPLLNVGQQSLIEHHLTRLAKLGFKHIVINLAYLGEQIQNTLGDGHRYGLTIDYSDESACGALETAGGLHHALPLIKSDPFIVINADIWTDFDFTQLLHPLSTSSALGSLVMVNNPSHNLNGDFALDKQGNLHLKNSHSTDITVTFSGIALYKKVLFSELNAGKQALVPIFRALIKQHKLDALKHNGQWTDVGTPERLHTLNKKNRSH